MKKNEFKYIYGPVPSWRLGSSLGVDPISQKDKICTFDCIYCQIGKTYKFSDKRKIYVQTDDIVNEIKSLPQIEIDYITFSGRGEPTLAKNLGNIINAVKDVRKNKIAVLTNSTLINREDVRKDLKLADFVIAKLDAGSDQSLLNINKSIKGINLNSILNGIKRFRSEYSGKFALQIMFVQDNKNEAEEIAKIAREINPDEIQINTPLRPCGTSSLSEKELSLAEKKFKDMNIVSVYKAKKKIVRPISENKTLIRRGKV